MNKITVRIDRGNNSPIIEYRVEMGYSLLELSHELELDHPERIIAAYVDNRIKGLGYKIYKPCLVRFTDISSFAGMRAYLHTVSLILQCAVEELMPDLTLYIRHSMGSNGLYCEMERSGEIVTLSPDQIARIEDYMRSIVHNNDPIISEKLPTEVVKQLYEERGYHDKIVLLETRPRLYSQISRLRNSIGYFYGALAPSTNYTPNFGLESYLKGFYVALPLRDNTTQLSQSPHQDKMYNIFQFYQRWVDIMGVQTVGALNAKVLAGEAGDMIKLAEALSERSIASAIDDFAKAHEERGCKLIFLAGPSSSGKTTTSKRLCIHLQMYGFKPVLISMDDYFVDRELTPRDAAGEYDFEALEAVNVAQFNKDLNELLEGKSLCTPRYDFVTGRSLMHDKPLQLCDKSVVVIEGIHGLNPRLSCDIPQDKIFRIYASCFTVVAMDGVSRIASSDNRLLRRLIRDYATRGSSAQATLHRWESVRRGEEKHIFPYQEHADLMINTSLFYEISVLRPYAEAILRDVPNTSIEFEEANRLLKLLDQFIVISPDEIPQTSTIREFIGGGSFTY